MDTEHVLDKMHNLHLILADEVKRVCDKYQIKYFMIAGTLLGAVRHKGFIPWDDDMDFGMTRNNFEKFLKCSESEIDSEKFYLQTDRKDKYYAFNFAKLRLRGTKVVESFSQDVNAENGIYIDIFPIDNLSNNILKRAIQLKSFYIARNFLLVKCGYGNKEQKNFFIYKLAKIGSFFFSIEQLKLWKNYSISKYKNKNSTFVITSDGTYGLKKEILKRKWVDNLQEYCFEDRIYPGIADYKEYLTYFYGNYMELPPVDKRNHHGRLEVDFGIYR